MAISIHTLAHLWALPTAKRRLAWRAFGCLPLLHWSIQWLGFTRTCRLVYALAPALHPHQPTGDRSLTIYQCELLLYQAIHGGLHPGNCLSASLTLWLLLRSQGIDSALRIGVRTVDGRFQAHAWIEVDGEPVSEVKHVRQHYATFGADLLAPPDSIR